MDLSLQNKIVSFIWSIADDCLRDVYVRGKYRDVILPMFVLRRLDCLLEETKNAVVEEVRFQREEAGFTVLDPVALREESGYVFYNTSDWTLKKLVKTAANNRQILEANFKAYLDGFSDNVKEIIEKFELRNQIRRMVQADVLLDVLEKFTSPYINLSPHDTLDPEGRKLVGLSNLGMGYVFEELIRKFNEENNEEAGEHFTPREVIKLMTHLLFIPVKDKLPPVITVYDGACGSGGMLTESQDFIKDLAGEIKSLAAVYLYGINFQIDLGAERVLAAERQGEKIAVEIKSFLNPSAVTDFYAALGQFLSYRLALETTEPDRLLYLAVPLDIYETFFQLEFTQAAMQRYQLLLIVYEPVKEVIVQWIS